MSSLRHFELPSQVPSKAPFWDCASFLVHGWLNLGIVKEDANDMHWIRWILDLGFMHTREDCRTAFSRQVFLPQFIPQSHTSDFLACDRLLLWNWDQLIKNGRCEIWWATQLLICDAIHQRDCITVSVLCHGSFVQTFSEGQEMTRWENWQISDLTTYTTLGCPWRS